MQYILYSKLQKYSLTLEYTLVLSQNAGTEANCSRKKCRTQRSTIRYEGM